MECPICNNKAYAEFVDVGVGLRQVTPYHCACGWVEGGCGVDECEKERCISWDYCKGESLYQNL